MCWHKCSVSSPNFLSLHVIPWPETWKLSKVGFVYMVYAKKKLVRRPRSNRMMMYTIRSHQKALYMEKEGGGLPLLPHKVCGDVDLLICCFPS